MAGQFLHILPTRMVFLMIPLSSWRLPPKKIADAPVNAIVVGSGADGRGVQ
jgi:hypothetical protein